MFEKKPTFCRPLHVMKHTIPERCIPKGGIIPAGMSRMSRITQEKGNSLEDQKIITVGCGYKHQEITHPGMMFFEETCSGWKDIPATLLYILNDPEFSKVDDTGKCIACNFLFVIAAQRVIRNVEIFERLLPVLNKRGINIWSVLEDIGSLTDPEAFLRALTSAEDDSSIKSARSKIAHQKKGLRKCGEKEPTHCLDNWGPKEDQRLRMFVDPSNIPAKFIIPGKTAASAINWTKLAAEAIFKYRTAKQLKTRVRTLRVHPPKLNS